jgi:hypothetical protein
MKEFKNVLQSGGEISFYWKFKTCKTQQALKEWLEKNKGKIQYHHIFLNEGYGVEYRRLKVIDI